MSASLVVSHVCDFCVAFCRYSSKAGSVKKMYLVKKNIVNLIDDIFWKMGFKTETDAEKVINRIISLILDYKDYINYCILFTLYHLFGIIQIILIILTQTLYSIL